jgi:hypothetical protein
MPNEPHFTRLNANAVLLVAVGLLLGFITGYIARPRLEAQPVDAAALDPLLFVTEKGASAFPYTFENRRQAVAWLRQQITFLDRNTRGGGAARAMVDDMKRQLARIEESSTIMLPAPLFVNVNEEVQRMQETLTGTAAVGAGDRATGGTAVQMDR